MTQSSWMGVGTLSQKYEKCLEMKYLLPVSEILYLSSLSSGDEHVTSIMPVNSGTSCTTHRWHSIDIALKLFLEIATLQLTPVATCPALPYIYELLQQNLILPCMK